MDFDEYVAARHSTLLRTAVLLGCPEYRAPAVVSDVLTRSIRRIRKADDPDPEVFQALLAAIPGARETELGASRDPQVRQSLVMSAAPVGADIAGPVRPDLPTAAGAQRLTRPQVSLPRPPPWQALVALAGVVGLLLIAAQVGSGPPLPPNPGPLAVNQVPSLFGYDTTTAQALLTSRGYRVEVQPARACELGGRILSSDPPTGSPVVPGATVTIRPAVPSDPYCLAHYEDRARAWRFVDFATGRGPAPDFADRVTLVVDAGYPETITGADALDAANWGGLSALSELRRLSDRVVRDGATYAVPVLSADTRVPPRRRCGVDRPVGAGDRSALSISIDVPTKTSPGTPLRCPTTVDVYTSSQGIEAVVLYTARSTRDVRAQ